MGRNAADSDYKHGLWMIQFTADASLNLS